MRVRRKEERGRPLTVLDGGLGDWRGVLDDRAGLVDAAACVAGQKPSPT